MSFGTAYLVGAAMGGLIGTIVGLRITLWSLRRSKAFRIGFFLGMSKKSRVMLREALDAADALPPIQ